MLMIFFCHPVNSISRNSRRVFEHITGILIVFTMPLIVEMIFNRIKVPHFQKPTNGPKIKAFFAT